MGRRLQRPQIPVPLAGLLCAALVMLGAVAQAQVAASPKGQRAKVESLLAQGKFEQALLEAKSYYNVVALSQTRDAVELMADALERARGSPAAAMFREWQRGSSGDPAVSQAPTPETQRSDSDLEKRIAVLWATIKVNPVVYEPALQKPLRPRNVSDLLARGNVLLLADRPADARQCFESACDLAAKDGKHIGWTLDAIEGIARALRAESASVSKADEFILSLQRQALSGTGPSKQHDMRTAAWQVVTSGISTDLLPPLELARLRSESDLAGSVVSSVRISADFDCASPLELRTLSPTQFQLTLAASGFCNWFLFRVEGASGKIVRIDVKPKDVSIDKWSTLNPVYVDADRLDDPDVYALADDKTDAQGTVAWNGARLPDTAGQRWHYIESAWRHDANTLSFVHRFGAETVYVGMRVPYTPGFHDHYLRQIASNPRAKVIEVGYSREHRPLTIVSVGAASDQTGRNKPCVLLYAGEHADEPDAMWALHGTIDYLISDDPQASQLRDHYAFLLIPMLDPDGTSGAQYESITRGFCFGRTMPETIAYANWFKRWVDAGNRLDLVLNLHNLESREGPHISCALLDGSGERGRLSSSLHQLILRQFQERGMTTRARPGNTDFSVNKDRLGGWLTACYGPITLIYEINSQAPERHLNLRELAGMGQTLCTSVGEFFSTADGVSLLATVDQIRQNRTATWAKYGSKVAADENAIVAEAQCRAKVQEETIQAEFRRTGTVGPIK